MTELVAALTPLTVGLAMTTVGLAIVFSCVAMARRTPPPEQDHSRHLETPTVFARPALSGDTQPSGCRPAGDGRRDRSS